jgi:16S rRNA (guanine527-N7)-methyltransferase
VLAECAAPFLEVSGLLVVSEPPAENVGRWSQAGLAELGLAELDVLAGPPRLRRFRQTASCPDRYPRRTGIPAKRPLW